MTFRAASLAARLHAEQLDQRGELHMDHLTAVATLLRERWPDVPDYAAEAAWLHHAIGDKGATSLSLLKAGVSPEAVRLVEVLTKPEGVDHPTWIETLASSREIWAIRIQLADFAHTPAPSRARLEATERALCEAGLNRQLA